MQSTGQASTQAVSLVPMQGSAITYVISTDLPLDEYLKPNCTAGTGTAKLAGQSPRSELSGRGHGLYPSTCKHVLKEAQDLIGEQPVGGHDLLAVEAKGTAIEAHHRPTRFQHQQHARRRVPGVEIEFPKRVHPA